MSPRFKMVIQDVFTIEGRGIVVMGRIESGMVRLGDSLRVEGPAAPVVVRVESIEKFRETGLTEAAAGADVGLGIAGPDSLLVRRGFVLKTQ